MKHVDLIFWTACTARDYWDPRILLNQDDAKPHRYMTLRPDFLCKPYVGVSKYTCFEGQVPLCVDTIHGRRFDKHSCSTSKSLSTDGTA